MKIRDKKILDTLREGPLSHLSDLEFKMIRDAVKENGIDGVSGYAASMIADGKRRLAFEMKKAKQVRVGDMVSWDSSGGRAEGKVLRIENSGRINVPGSSFNIQGEEEDPAVLITLYRDGKPTDTKVGDKMSTLKKKIDLSKHGDHDQSSHGTWSDESEGEYVDNQGLHPRHRRSKDDSEGEFGDSSDDNDMEAMDMMDILRPPKSKK